MRTLEVRGETAREVPDCVHHRVGRDGDVLTVASRSHLDLPLASQQGADGDADGDAEE